MFSNGSTKKSSVIFSQPDQFRRKTIKVAKKCTVNQIKDSGLPFILASGGGWAGGEKYLVFPF